jgi:hypothetical protein
LNETRCGSVGSARRRAGTTSFRHWRFVTGILSLEQIKNTYTIGCRKAGKRFAATLLKLTLREQHQPHGAIISRRLANCSDR